MSRREKKTTPNNQSRIVQGNREKMLAALTEGHGWGGTREMSGWIVATGVSISAVISFDTEWAVIKDGDPSVRLPAVESLIATVVSGSIDINNIAIQAAAYRALEAPLGDTLRRPASSKATKVPCHMKWIRAQPNAITSGSASRGSTVFIASCLLPIYPGIVESSPVHQP